MKALPLLVLSLLAQPLSAQDRERAPRPGRDSGGPMRPTFNDAPRESRPFPGRADRVDVNRVAPGRAGTAVKTMDQATLPAPVPRTPGPLSTYPGTHVVVPPAWNRCQAFPDETYWRTRDLFNEFRWMARTGFIPVTAVPDETEELTDVALFPAGWRCYGVAIPAGGKLSVELSHSNLGWFRLMAVRKDGTPGPGMLHAMAAYRPVAFTLANPTEHAGAVYIIVDDPGWMSSKENPYKLTFKRDWDPAKVDLKDVKMVQGIWGASPSVSAEFRGPSLTGPAVYPH